MFWFYIHVCLQNITGLYINLVFLYVCVLLMSLHMHAFAIMSPFFACKNTVVFCCCGCLTPTATNEIPSCYWGRLWLKLDCMIYIYIYMYIYTRWITYIDLQCVCVCACLLWLHILAMCCHSGPALFWPFCCRTVDEVEAAAASVWPWHGDTLPWSWRPRWCEGRSQIRWR